MGMHVGVSPLLEKSCSAMICTYFRRCDAGLAWDFRTCWKATDDHNDHWTVDLASGCLGDLACEYATIVWPFSSRVLNSNRVVVNDLSAHIECAARNLRCGTAHDHYMSPALGSGRVCLAYVSLLAVRQSTCEFRVVACGIISVARS